ncbi:MAG: ATP-binding cassette domain-containing protein [Azospirillum sp.]|nr:ATP-binding cassette domain-containing protein [Azospirillum sp.]
MTGCAIEIVEKRFPAVAGAPARTVLGEIVLDLPADQFVAVTGPSGCGKTTLLNIVAGLDLDWRGRLELPRRPDGSVSLAYMFQTPRLLPWRTVAENLALVRPRGIADPAGWIRRRLAAVGLDEGVAAVYPGRLSQGMSRRVALARALAVEPDLLLMDEPFASLDGAAAGQLRALVARLWRERPMTVVLVTHDLREALGLADRIVLLGGAPARVLADRANPLPFNRRCDDDAVEPALRALAGRFARELNEPQTGGHHEDHDQDGGHLEGGRCGDFRSAAGADGHGGVGGGRPCHPRQAAARTDIRHQER